MLRIGINLGDIIIEDDGDVFGDGVNVAARLEQMADPGGSALSGKIYEEVEGKIDRTFESRGEQQVKNSARPVRVYALAGSDASEREPDPLLLPGQTFNRCPAVHEHERRPRTGLFRRWYIRRTCSPSCRGSVGFM